MIHYRIEQWSKSEIKFPILHRVDYNGRHEKDWFIMHEWCKRQCKAPFYWAPQWAGTFVEFEDDEDATMFALKWS